MSQGDLEAQDDEENKEDDVEDKIWKRNQTKLIIPEGTNHENMAS